MNPIVNKIRDKMKLPKTPQSEPPRLRRADAVKEPKGRLPDLSHFEALYNAETKRWSGSLRVPNQRVAIAGAMPLQEGEDLTFTAEASALVKLCFKLDDLYRAWLVSREVKS